MYSLYRRHLSETAKSGASAASATTVTTAPHPSTISAVVDSAATLWELQQQQQQQQHVTQQTAEASSITVTTAGASVSSCHASNPVSAAPYSPPPASSPPLSTGQILLSPHEGRDMDEGNISNSGIPSPPAVSPSPMPPQSHTISHSDMGKPRPPHSASHKQTVFDGEGVFTITRSPSVVTQQPSLTVLPHQPHDEDHDDLHNNNIISTNNKEVSEKYQLGLDPLKDGSNKKDTTAPVTNTVHAAGVAAAFGGGAVVASTAAAAASAADDPCSAYMRRVCCEALCDPLCLMCCLACNADCCSGCANLDLCCLLCHICTRL